MKIFLPVVLIFFFLFSNGQKPKSFPKLPSEKQIDQKIKDERCVFRAIYSETQLKSKFPFNQVGAIKLISFETKMEDEIGILHNFFHLDSGQHYHIDSTMIDTSNWKEVITLDTSRYQLLVNLMFNYAPFKISDLNIEWQSQCYRSKNAIVFYNRYNEIFAVIEICFECERMSFFPNDFKLAYDCTTKFELFRNFFADQGIEYGIEK
jgi:hypothetical protein